MGLNNQQWHVEFGQVDDIRIARTDLAPNMLATGALGGMRSEYRITPVTCPSHSLPDWPADEILTAGSRGQRQLVLSWLGLYRLHCLGLRLLGEKGLERGPGLFLLVLGLRLGMARAFLASNVLAVHADLVGAESRLAAMAGAADSHAAGLGDTLNGDIASGLPLSRFQGHSIFRK